MRLFRHPKETEGNKRRLKKLVQGWCRPMMQADIKFIEAIRFNADSAKRDRILHRNNAIRKQARKPLVPDEKRDRARVPERPYFDFACMPATGLSERDHEELERASEKSKSGHKEKQKSINKRFDTLRRKMKMGVNKMAFKP